MGKENNNIYAIPSDVLGSRGLLRKGQILVWVRLKKKWKSPSNPSQLISSTQSTAPPRKAGLTLHHRDVLRWAGLTVSCTGPMFICPARLVYMTISVPLPPDTDAASLILAQAVPLNVLSNLEFMRRKAEAQHHGILHSNLNYLVIKKYKNYKGQK